MGKLNAIPSSLYVSLSFFIIVCALLGLAFVILAGLIEVNPFVVKIT
jgi:hypothetical protein